MKPWRNPAFLCAVAASGLAVALQLSSGLYEPVALAITTIVSAVALAAAVQTAGGPALPAQVALGAGLLHGLYCHLFLVPTFYAQAFPSPGFRALALLAAIFLSAYLCLHLRASLERLRFRGSLALFAAMALAVLRASPRPYIDVFYLRTVAARVLRAGGNPFAFGYPDIYGPAGASLYAPGIAHHGRLWFYPYPPLVPLFDQLWPSDPRVVSLVAMLVAAWAIARLGGNVTAELAAMLLLFQGRGLFVLEQAWTEPYTLAAFAVAVLLLALRAHWVAIGLALGVCAATKQYMPLVLLPLALVAPWRSVALAVAFALATLLPFAAWDFEALRRSLITSQISIVRLDSLSLLALWGRTHVVGAWAAVPGFVAAAGALALTLRRRPLAQAVTASAAVWLVFLLFNKQAFCNYYWLGGGLLCVSIAAWSRKEVTA